MSYCLNVPTKSLGVGDKVILVNSLGVGCSVMTYRNKSYIYISIY